MSYRSVFAAGGTAAVAIVLSAAPVFAASLYFSPDAKTVVVGQAFTIAVDVSSPDQAMNAASGDISFPADKLEVLSVSKVDSIMNLWVKDPSFSNSIAGGNVHFEGIVLNPGFIGVGGTVVRIAFQALAPGDASLSFSDGSVLANDGNGTNILNNLGTASFAIVPAPIQSNTTSTSIPVVATATTPFPVTETTTPVSVPYHPVPVTSNNWMLLAWSFFILIILLCVAIMAVIFYIANRFKRPANKKIADSRKELREDLKRIEREMEGDRSSANIDLSASGVKKKQQHIRREIEHLEEDIERDLKDSS